MKKHYSPFLALFVLAVLVATAHAWLPTQEIQAIASLMQAMPGLSDPHGDFYWNPNHPEDACRFDGVYCSDVAGTDGLQTITTLLILGKTGGYIPESIGALQNLTGLRMVGTELTGTVPASLMTLTKMYSLTIHDSFVTGSLPDVTAMKDLHFLEFSKSQFSGVLPASYSTLPKIQYLTLDDNQLTGPIPTSWTTWRSIQILSIKNNQLSGSVPGFAGDVNLRKFDLSGNQFSGVLPTLIGPTLMEIDLSDNHITGTIPSWNMQWRLPSPQQGQLTWFVLNLRNNSLVGTIPDIFDSAPYWDIINLSDNKLSGTVPDSLTSSELNVWTGIFLEGNQLSLCPAPKKFEVKFGSTRFGSLGICRLNDQATKPPCSCVTVYDGTHCAPIDCI